jgi:hypothetical protein
MDKATSIKSPTAVMAVMPEQMSFPTELLQKIINHYLDILDDLISQVDRHIIHEDWLAISHTSPQFRNLLGDPSLEACNPYKMFTAEFEGQMYNGLAVDFQKAIDLFGMWADHLNVLQSTTPFPITLTMKIHSLLGGTRRRHTFRVRWTAKAPHHRNHQFI